MNEHEIAGFAAATGEVMREAVASLRTEHAQAMAEMRSNAEQVARSLEQRGERAEAQAAQLQRDLDALREAAGALRAEQAHALAELRSNSEHIARSLEQRTDGADARAEQLQRNLDAVREAAAEPAIRAALMDIDGALHIVQRSGPPLIVRIADLQALVSPAVCEAMSSAEARVGAQLNSQVARAMQRLGAAPRWSRTAIYGPETIVSCYVGRTYALRDGVRASMAQEPGEHPEVWERIGSHGLRVMKSKPEQLEAGDVFTEAESRFIHDGENTTLFVPRMTKHSDIERMVKPTHALAQSAMDHARNAEQAVESLRVRVDEDDEGSQE